MPAKRYRRGKFKSYNFILIIDLKVDSEKRSLYGKGYTEELKVSAGFSTAAKCEFTFVTLKLCQMPLQGSSWFPVN